MHVRATTVAAVVIAMSLSFHPAVRADDVDEIQLVRVKCPSAAEEVSPISNLLPAASEIPIINNFVVDLRDASVGLDVDYQRRRLFAPGATHWGQASFTSAFTLGGSKELQAWFEAAAKGEAFRKHISVTLFKSDKTPGRSYLLSDCAPVTWTGGRVSAEGAAETETIRVRIGRIDFKV